MTNLGVMHYHIYQILLFQPTSRVGGQPHACLQQRKHIHGTAPTLKDLLNPIEETEISHLDYRFPGGDNEIVAQPWTPKTICIN
jgi:hypothetical protein